MEMHMNDREFKKRLQAIAHEKQPVQEPPEEQKRPAQKEPPEERNWPPRKEPPAKKPPAKSRSTANVNSLKVKRKAR
jgi:hypothetical protein